MAPICSGTCTLPNVTQVLTCRLCQNSTVENTRPSMCQHTCEVFSECWYVSRAGIPSSRCSSSQPFRWITGPSITEILLSCIILGILVVTWIKNTLCSYTVFDPREGDCRDAILNSLAELLGLPCISQVFVHQVSGEGTCLGIQVEVSKVGSAKTGNDQLPNFASPFSIEAWDYYTQDIL